MHKFDSFCGTCPICLNLIAPDQEAFLDQCFHHFCYKCLKEWTATQRRHPPQKGGSSFTCPLCKQAYYSIIYDCENSAFSRDQVSAPPRGSRAPAHSAAPFALLTSAHRRRRSVYYSPVDEGEQMALAPATLAPRLASREDVPRWVGRELQALMWQDDVALVVQHVLGTLRSAAAAPSSSKPAQQRYGSRPASAGKMRKPRLAAPTARNGAPGAAPAAKHAPQGLVGGGVALKRKASALGGGGAASQAGQPTAEDVAAAVAKAAAPYVFEHAERFGWELAAFVASGLGVVAYDRQVGLHPDVAMPAGASAMPAGPHAGAPNQGSAEVAGATGSPSGQSEEGEAEPSTRSSSSHGGGPSEDEAESVGRGFGSALARDADSEGYLGLLLAQGRRRRRLGSPGGAEDAAGASGDGADVALLGPAGRGDTAEAGEVISGAGGPQDGDPSGLRDTAGAGPPGGADVVGSAAGEGQHGADLDDLRCRALQALQHYRRGSGSQGSASKQ